MPANTTAYCLIIHDRVVQYNPLINVVRKSPKRTSDMIKSTIRRIRLQSITIFSTTCSCQRSWICKDSSKTKNLLKEVAVLKQGTVLTHYIFTSPVSRKFLTRSDRSCASWLSAYHHELRWEDGMVPYNEAKRLIMTAVFEHDVIVYVKGHEKRTWLELAFGR